MRLNSAQYKQLSTALNDVFGTEDDVKELARLAFDLTLDQLTLAANLLDKVNAVIGKAEELNCLGRLLDAAIDLRPTGPTPQGCPGAGPCKPYWLQNVKTTTRPAGCSASGCCSTASRSRSAPPRQRYPDRQTHLGRARPFPKRQKPQLPDDPLSPGTPRRL